MEINGIKPALDFYDDLMYKPEEQIIKPVMFQHEEEKIHGRTIYNRQTWVIKQIGEKLRHNFVIDQNNRIDLKLLLLYFAGDNSFINQYQIYNNKNIPGDLNKGICLIGGVGSGKTLLFQIFQEYTQKFIKANQFTWYNEQEIINKFSISGIDAIKEFTSDRYETKHIYIDDLASKQSESKIKYWGNNIDVIENVLNTRYVSLINYRQLTHISTNIYSKFWANIFDLRLNDRMKEMFNIIELQGNSRRI
jgi:hypothetical protein